MTISFEFAAAVREKAGVSGWNIALDEDDGSVLDALKELEMVLPQRSLEITAGDEVRKNILVFKRDLQGKQVRIAHPKDTSLETGTIILLASAMGGG